MKALLLVIHGTRDRAGLAEIRRFVQKVREYLAPVRVEFALLTSGYRSVPDTVGRMRKAGIREIDVLPFLLFSGLHVRRDIPRMLAEIKRENPGLKLRYGKHIGPSDAAVRIALERWKDMTRQ